MKIFCVMRNLFISLALLGSILISCQNENRIFTDISDPILVHDKHSYSISVPQDWDAHLFLNGDHGDTDISAVFNRHLQIGSAVTIAVKESDAPTLEDAIGWGESRINQRYKGTSENYSVDLDEVKFVERNGTSMVERNHMSNNNGLVLQLSNFEG